MPGADDHRVGPVLCVVGARPNYMKMAPLMRAFRAHPALPRAVLVHTGQHYDYAMNGKLFADLRMPAPDINLEVGSASHAVQTAEVMKRFEPLIDRYAPSCVIVAGDVNSTIACALVASKRGVPVAHVEAGLRSFDRSMPEEINRVLTDQISDLLYTTEAAAADNLLREGIAAERIHFVGNLMIDSLRDALPISIAPADAIVAAGKDPEPIRDGFGVVTLHRPSNVDAPHALTRLLRCLADLSKRLTLVWPMHPRTRASVERFALGEYLTLPRLLCLPPQGYLEMVGLMNAAAVVLTDSGGMQEETTALGVPCFTLRENTERPVTIEQGTNTLVGTDPSALEALLGDVLSGKGKRGRIPERWDGKTASRISEHLAGWLAQRAPLGVRG